MFGTLLDTVISRVRAASLRSWNRLDSFYNITWQCVRGIVCDNLCGVSGTVYGRVACSNTWHVRTCSCLKSKQKIRWHVNCHNIVTHRPCDVISAWQAAKIVRLLNYLHSWIKFKTFHFKLIKDLIRILRALRNILKVACPSAFFIVKC